MRSRSPSRPSDRRCIHLGQPAFTEKLLYEEGLSVGSLYTQEVVFRIRGVRFTGRQDRGDIRCAAGEARGMTEHLPVCAGEVRAVLEAAIEGDLNDRYPSIASHQQAMRVLEAFAPDESRRCTAVRSDEAIELTHGDVQVIGDLLRGEIGKLDVCIDVAL